MTVSALPAGAARLSASGVVLWFSVAVVGLTALCALVPGLIAPHDPVALDPASASLPPSATHWFGTDQLGRDVFSRTVAGTRSALVGPLLVALGVVAVGALGALLGGLLGGLTDSVITRAADIVYALPSLIVAVVVVGVLGGGYALAVVVLIAVNFPSPLRLLRAEVISRRGLPYIEAGIVMGLPRRRLLFRHLLPNLEPMVVTTFFLALTYGMVEFSGLSFLGLGAPPGALDWGRMIAENRVTIFQNAWATIGPSIVLVVVVVSINIVGQAAYARLEQHRRVR